MTHWEIARGAVGRKAIQKVGEFAGLVRLLQRRRLRTVLEIGTCKGGSLWAWCQLAEPDALIVSVDMPDEIMVYGGYTDSERERIERYRRPGQTLELIQGDSHDPAIVQTVRRILAGRKLDLLFIDGDHSYQGVKADFENYQQFAGGVVVFHDILEHPDVLACQVKRFWDELKNTRAVREFVCEPYHWGGIGVIEL